MLKLDISQIFIDVCEYVCVCESEREREREREKRGQIKSSKANFYSNDSLQKSHKVRE